MRIGECNQSSPLKWIYSEYEWIVIILFPDFNIGKAYSLPSFMISFLCLCGVCVFFSLLNRVAAYMPEAYCGQSLLLDYCISCQLTVSLYKGHFNI